MIATKRKALKKDHKNDEEPDDKKKNETKIKKKKAVGRVTRKNDQVPSSKTKQKENCAIEPEEDEESLIKVPVYRDSSSFFDSICYGIKEKKKKELKQKQKTQRDRLKEVKNVQISTPKNKLKRKCNLLFDISPISTNSIAAVRLSQLKIEKSEPVNETKKRSPINDPPLVEKQTSQNEIIDVLKVSKVAENKASEATEVEATKACVNINLKPGKWRQSLVTWRKSHNPTKLIRRSSKRFVGLLPILTDPGVVKDFKLKLQKSLEKSALLEQSDEGSLQAELSILDSSIECASISKSYVLQRKPSQRETRVFKKSSIFYGLSSPLIDVDVLSGLSARQVVLRRCGLQEPLCFNDIYSESQLPNLTKIGEGVYGEVFMYRLPDEDPVVLKIIPIEGDIIVNGGPQKQFSEILTEIVIAEELSKLRNGKENKTDGFVRIKRVECVRGAYPQHLLDAWEIFNDSCLKGSENDNPEIFDDNQLYIVFEQYHAGIDLEAFIFKNSEEAFSVFLQVALTLAVAENKFEFEHRDLHWGNILLSRTHEKFLKYHVDGKVYEIPSYGVKATIIDFTLSRMVYDGAVIYDDLEKDPELFESTGDYQFDIYRLMRYRLETDFKRYDPYTNLLWLHYMLDKLIDGARYKYSKSDKHKSALNKMMQLRDTLLDERQSASDFVKSLKI